MTVIFDFHPDDGATLPNTSVITGPGGVLYGTAAGIPNPNSGGSVYSLTPPAAGGDHWTYGLIYTFAPAPSIGYVSPAGLTIDSHGVLYGTAEYGGNTNDSVCSYGTCGFVYSLTPPAAPGGAWTETTLYNFTGGTDGSNPWAGVTIGAGASGSVVLYGVTAFGGSSGLGTVFSLAPPASGGGPWTETTIYSFATGVPVAAASSVTIGSDGTLYGTQLNGGAYNHGAVFSLSPPASPGGAWTETTLYSFTGGNDGSEPNSRLLTGMSSEGQPVLYGSTLSGGKENVGVAYSLTPAESGPPWTLSVLHVFGTAAGEGLIDPGPLVWGNDGALYGSTYEGGAQSVGSVFALKPTASGGSSWSFVVLYSFSTGASGDGPSYPYIGEILAVSPSGVIYGTTHQGGAKGYGTVFTLRP